MFQPTEGSTPLAERIIARTAAVIIFSLCSATIFTLRWENVDYYWYRPFLNAYSVGVAAFILSRFAIALFYRPPRDVGLEPTVSIVITAFNEADAIYRTVACCYAVDYPRKKLEIIAVDDGSKDRTYDELLRARGRWPDLLIERFTKNKGKREAMAAGPVLLPISRIRAAEPMQRVLRERERQVVPEDLDDQDHDVDVVKEAKIDVRDAERHLRAIGTGECHPDGGDVVAPEHADRRIDRPAAAAALALAVQEAPHIRQKRHELAVVALLELFRIAAELVAQLAPRVLTARLRQDVPRFLDLRTLLDRHELQRPEQDFPELPDEWALIGHIFRIAIAP